MPSSGRRTRGLRTPTAAFSAPWTCTGLTAGLSVRFPALCCSPPLPHANSSPLRPLPTVARMVSEDATAAQCQSRYTRTLDPRLRRGPWTPDEDEQLKRAAAVFGHAWIEVATFVEGRNNEQCRDRFQEYLNPTVARGKWTPTEDAALLSAVERVGEGKWKEVSRVLDIGRTDNMVCPFLRLTCSSVR